MAKLGCVGRVRGERDVAISITRGWEGESGVVSNSCAEVGGFAKVNVRGFMGAKVKGVGEERSATTLTRLLFHLEGGEAAFAS